MGGPGGPMPQGGPPGAAPGAMMPPGGQPQMQQRPPMQGQPMDGGGQQPPGQQPMTPAQMAADGRFGDAVVAHLTPGEIQIPPQVQNPSLMEAIQRAFAKAGVSPQQFTAGSPQSSHNPATGAPEYSLLAALLPILGGAAGSFIPGLGTGIGAAIGGGLGGAAGGLMDKSGAAGTLAQAAGGALGGYAGGGGFGGASSAANGAGEAVDIAGNPTTDAAAAGATGAASSSPYGGGGMFGSTAFPALKPGFGAGLGAMVGGALTPPSTSSSSGLPSSFTNPLAPLNPAFNSLLGNSNASKVGFNGYNPYAAATGGVPGGYNFYAPGNQ